jgi:bacterioferritin (cytochrome b1)
MSLLRRDGRSVPGFGILVAALGKQFARGGFLMNPAETTADPGPLAQEVEAINSLLCLELAAIEVYGQVLGGLEGHPFANDLRTIRYAHETAADALRNHIRNLGGEPTDEAGLTVRLYSSTGTTGSPEELIGHLRQMEERAVAEYERVLQREQMPDECRFAIRVEMLSHCHEHIDVLAAMAGALALKG